MSDRATKSMYNNFVFISNIVPRSMSLWANKVIKYESK